MLRDRTPLRQRARDRWTTILLALGVSERHLTGKHGPCPICQEGKDRFRFDNKDGLGTWICSVCGAGDGVQLVMEVLGLEFRDAAREIEAHLGGAPVEPSRVGMTDAEKRQAMNRVWTEAQVIQPGDPVALWLANRIGLTTFPACLRTSLRLRYQGDQASYHPAMIAMVTGPDGKPATLHRTYLTNAGQKARVEEPRRLMAGAVPKGSAIRLADHGPVLGIAEGIETAFAATALFGVPCWSAINTTILSQWEPPECVREIIVFGDNDPKFGGHAAAYALAHRLAARSSRTASVKIPDIIGQDWNDVWLQQQERIAA